MVHELQKLIVLLLSLGMLSFGSHSLLIEEPLVNLGTQANPPIMWTSSWSKSGNYIALGGDEGILWILDGKSYEVIRTDTLGEGIMRVRWHPTEDLLAVAAGGLSSHVLDVFNDQRIELSGMDYHGGRSIAWDHRGERLVIADYEGLMSIWERNGTLQKIIDKGATKSYVAVDWKPKSDEIVALSEYAWVYDAVGTLSAKFKHREEEVLMLSVAWHPSGDFYVIGDYGVPDKGVPPVLQWWSSEHELIRESKISKAEYRNVRWSPDGQKLATASDALRIWSADGKLLFEGTSDEPLWGVDWHPEQDRIVTTDQSGKVYIWDVQANKLKQLSI